MRFYVGKACVEGLRLRFTALTEDHVSEVERSSEWARYDGSTIVTGVVEDEVDWESVESVIVTDWQGDFTMAAGLVEVIQGIRRNKEESREWAVRDEGYFICLFEEWEIVVDESCDYAPGRVVSVAVREFSIPRWDGDV